MAFTFEEIGQDRLLAVSDEYTEDLYLQTLELNTVPSIDPGANVIAVFGIYSVDTCKTARTSFGLETLHCQGDGGGDIYDAQREIEYDPNVLHHYEQVASNRLDVATINANFPSLFAIDIKQRFGAWITVGSLGPESVHMRVALLGIYFHSQAL